MQGFLKGSLRMSRSFVLLCAAVLLVFSLAAEAASAAGRAPVVVAYVFPQNALLQPGEIDARAVTRINYAFADIRDGRMVTGYAHDAENFAALTALRKENPSLTVLVSVGGWLGSGGFSDAALTKESRKVFIDSVMDFLGRYDLDGLDIDWEYPGMAGAGHTFRTSDKRNFTLLLENLRKRFDAEQQQGGRKLYLTIAAGATQDFLDHTQMARVARLVDTVNLMSYDYYEPGSEPITGHHAPLFTNPADPNKFSADDSVKAFEHAGVPAEKILLGVPFYGHEWGDVSENAHGLYQPGKQIPGAYSSYSVIASTMLGNGYTRYWDAASSAPYLYNAEKHIFVSYEDAESIAAKGRYVLEHKLGGIMFWDYEGDPSGTLLHAVDVSLGLGAAR
jgi:chitinase